MDTRQSECLVCAPSSAALSTLVPAASTRPAPLQAGTLAGIAGLTFASFTAVSYLEVKRKIEGQLAAGEDPYELRVEPRAQPPVKRSGGGGNGGGGGGKKKGGGGGKRK